MKKVAAHPSFPASTIQHTALTSNLFLVFAWASTLLLSALPLILSRELHIFQSVSFLQFRVVLLLALLALGVFWEPARRLRAYFLIFLVLYLAEALFAQVSVSALQRTWLVSISPGFARDMLSTQILRLAVALIMIAAVWLLHPRWGKFLLSKGDRQAPAEPVRWLGMGKPLNWTRFGIILTICITGGTLAFLLLSARPSGDVLTRILPLMPVILLLALMNAFSEEIIYRASLLAPLQQALGKSQALLLTAVLFGLWHFYGVPYGVVGVLMSGALGWLLGKSMLETKGVFWAVFIHFWQDVAIFAFLAAGSVTPGG